MPQKKLRVLFAETSQVDVRSILANLTDNNYLVEHQHAENADAIKAALLAQSWDVVLCSFNPDIFDGIQALKLKQSFAPDLPFFFILDKLSAEEITRAINAGADGYIFKDGLNRLAPALEKHLQEAAIRHEHSQMLLELKENQARLQSLISNLPGMAYQLLQTTSNGVSFSYVSDGCQDLLGLPPQDLERDSALFLDILHPSDRNSYKKAIQISAKNLSFIYWEGRIKSLPDGEIKWVNLRCTPRKMPQGVQWEGMIFNITERKLAEIEAMRTQEQLRELSAHIQDVREQERLALARDVHDDMGSMLTAIKMDVAWLSNHLPNQDAPLTEKVKDIENLVTRCAASASNISRNLRPSALDCFGIVAAIEIEASEFEQRTSIAYELDTIEEDAIVSPDIAITLFRIFQEALNNIMKHAQATKIKVSIYNRISNIELIVNDNGCGLSEPDRLKPRSFGLRGIQERVVRFGGKVKISGQPGRGTTIAVNIPHAVAETKKQQAPQQTLF